MVRSSISSQNLTLKPIKFVCSYGGRILPRYPDGKLRYHGGETRVIAVERSVSFFDLLVKLGEMCGSTVNLRCQLPTEDLDALVSITSDEDLANLIEEYDRAAGAAAAPAAPPPSLKIRAFLSSPKTARKSSSSSSPPSSASSSSNGSSSPRSPFYPSGGVPPRFPPASNVGRCIRHASRPPVYPNIGGKVPYKQYAYHHQCQYHHHGHENGGHVYVIHWQ